MQGRLAIRSELADKVRRFHFLCRIRPNILATPFYSIVFPERRTIEHEGLRLHIDPASHLGRTLLLDGVYESETCEIFRQEISAGDTVLDIGANEGFFSALAATLVGESGCVIAVEPQSRVHDILEINLALNAHCQLLVARKAIAENDGEKLEISLFPRSNTGGSSLVRDYRWGGTEAVETVTPATLLQQSGRPRFDFVKIDVEGYEPEIVRSLPLHKVGKLLVDYHATILRRRGIDPAATDALITRTHKRVRGSLEGGYALYVLPNGSA